MGTDKTPLEKEAEMALFDQSKRAEVTLEEVLQEDTPDEIIEHELNYIPVSEARKGEHVLSHDTDRVMSRVLFITKDLSYLEEDSRSMKLVLDLATLFSEIHIMVLQPYESKEETKRVIDNVWVYRVYTKSWWQSSGAALGKAKEQLSFTDGFRPDIVVALDPYESGLAALRISSEFRRPLQVHVLENFDDDIFLTQEKGNIWRRTMARHVLNRSSSVRVSTDIIKQMLSTKFKRIHDLQILPQFHNFSSFIHAKPSFDVHD
ncbi:hypothetical protein N8083_02390, partial [Candidatus Pacebacteria bacterium]|nr:hypothetical protein [Candidatus Paceibacterota bacterium]